MRDALPLPGLRTRFAGQRHRPESPDLAPGRLLICRDETARAVLSSARPGYHEIPHREWRRRRKIIEARIGEFDVPQQLAVESIDRDQVRIVGLQKHAIAHHRYSAIRRAPWHSWR